MKHTNVNFIDSSKFFGFWNATCGTKYFLHKIHNRYDLNSIIPKNKNKNKNKNLNHNHNENKKKSSKTQNHKFCYSNLQFSSRV